jgi:hypothetical protein
MEVHSGVCMEVSDLGVAKPLPIFYVSPVPTPHKMMRIHNTVKNAVLFHILTQTYLFKTYFFTDIVQ